MTSLKPRSSVHGGGGEDKSVGGRIAANAVFDTNSPEYLAFRESVTGLTRDLIAEHDARRAGAKRIALTSSLNAEQMESISVHYPEFNVVQVPSSVPPHALYTAHVHLSNELCADAMHSMYFKNYVHLGGSVMMNLLAGRAGSHVEYDLTNPLTVHGKHSDEFDCHRLFVDPVNVRAVKGSHVDIAHYRRHLQGEAYKQCVDPSNCTQPYGGMVLDLAQNFMSPAQVASAMIQHNSDLALGFFLYSPDMLVSDKGELPDVNVRFQKLRVSGRDTAMVYRLQYLEGVAGVEELSAASWSAWLACALVDIGDPRYEFTIELKGTRGPFMHFAMVRVPRSVTGSSAILRRQLDLEAYRDMHVVSTWRLRAYGLDPTVAASWEHVQFTVHDRLLRRLFAYAMQVDAKQFTRHALRSQARSINDRTVVSGSEVHVAARLSPDTLDHLVTAVYVSAFIRRYEATTLSSELIDQFQQYKAFNSMTKTQKVKLMLKQLYVSTANALASPFSSVVRGGLDDFIDLASVQPLLPAPEFDIAPCSIAMGRVDIQHLIAAEFPSTDNASMLRQLAAMPVRSALPGAMVAGATKLVRSLREGIVYTTSSMSSAVGTAVAHLPFDAMNLALRSKMRAVHDMRIDNEEEEYDVLVPFVDAVEEQMESDYSPVANPVEVLNDVYRTAVHGVAEHNVDQDQSSAVYDAQDRVVNAKKLSLPIDVVSPRARREYLSKVQALGTAPYQQTLANLLDSANARNFNAPLVSLPQNIRLVKEEVWRNFVRTAMVPDAELTMQMWREKPDIYFNQVGFDQWMRMATREKCQKLLLLLEEKERTQSEMRIDEYIAMLKSDAKPPISEKPNYSTMAPQIIVYHETDITAFFSSMIRELVTRFMSLLKPNVMLMIRKSNDDLRKFIQRNHPFSDDGELVEQRLHYIENDFSKYDKSQDQFVFELEAYIFEQLGLNQELIQKWFSGHVECKIRVPSLGMRFEVDFQRKSGDATTAFGNGLLNMVSVMYAYQGLDYKWAVFVGDDSLICSGNTVYNESVRILQETFNLQAKMYDTTAPYFASNFVIFDYGTETVMLLPDPIKRIEKLSQPVPEEKPGWDEKFVSYQDIMAGYKYTRYTSKLPIKLVERYPRLDVAVASTVSDALATIGSSAETYRNVWEATPQLTGR